MYHPMLPHTTCDTIFVMHLCHGHGDMTLYDTGHGTCVMVSVMCGDEESCHDVTILRPHTWLRLWHRSRDGDHDSGHVMETMTKVIWRRPWHRSPSNIADNHQYQYLIFVVALRLSILLCVHMDDAHHDNYPPTWLSPCDSSSGSVCTLCTLRWWPLDPRTPRPVSRQCDSSSKYFSCCCKLTIFGPQYLILQWRPSGRDISVPTLHFPLGKLKVPAVWHL